MEGGRLPTGGEFYGEGASKNPLLTKEKWGVVKRIPKLYRDLATLKD